MPEPKGHDRIRLAECWCVWGWGKLLKTGLTVRTAYGNEHTGVHDTGHPSTGGGDADYKSERDPGHEEQDERGTRASFVRKPRYGDG